MSTETNSVLLARCGECGWIWVDKDEDACPNCGGDDEIYEYKEEEDGDR